MAVIHEELGPVVDPLLAGTVAEAWGRCMEHWRARGRVEDLPRDVRVTRYSPDFGEQLGDEFAAKFQGDYPFLLERLRSGDAAEVACALDLLVAAGRCFPDGQVPPEIMAVALPIPGWLRLEISGGWHEGFEGTTIGEFLRFELMMP